MNKDQAKGRVKEAIGKTQKDLGRNLGSRRDESEGASREAEGKLQKGFGDVKHKIGKAIDR